MTTSKYLLLVSCLVATIALLGFVGPFLISQKDTVMVAAGVFVILLPIVIAGYVALNVTRPNESKQENDNA